MKWGRLVIIALLGSGLGGCGGSAPVGPAPVTLRSIAVTPAGGTYQLPATEQFTATGRYSDASTKDLTQSVTWSSSDTSVATIGDSGSSKGMSTMVGSGSAMITAALGSIQNSTNISVSSSVTVSLSPTFASLTVTHQTQTFVAAIQGTTNSAVTWLVDGVAGGNSDTGIISDMGIYTPPGTKGPHTIAVTTQADLGKTASAKVIVMDNPGVFTRHYDNARTGQNINEIVLTPQNVNMQHFGKLFSYGADGAIYAQPLYVANVNIPSKGYHNVLYVATTNDTLYAFDADNQSVGILWQKSLVNGSAGETAVPCGDLPYFCGFAPTVGITGTPVIDPDTGTLYVATFSKQSGSYYHKLHALDIITGAEKFGGPVALEASVAGIGDGGDGTTVPFDAVQHLQRPALLLANGNIYIAFASYEDTAPYHGWVFAYNATTLQQVAVFNATPDGYDGGIWQSGGGLAADASGNIYLATGNGDFNANTTGGRDYGDSIIKLSPSLSVLDYFTAYNQATLDVNDQDLGAGGILLLPDQSGPHPHLAVEDGKPGEIYVVDRDNLGHFNAVDDSQIVQSMPGATGAVLSSPAYWDGHFYISDGGAVTIKRFDVNNGLLSTSPQVRLIPRPALGLAVSANGNQDGILWATQRQLSSVSTSPLLAAYDANDLSTEFYDSNQAGTRDVPGVAASFQPPLVINGKVYVSTKGEVDVYGLLPQ
jgi:hypothetical protein